MKDLIINYVGVFLIIGTISFSCVKCYRTGQETEYKIIKEYTDKGYEICKPDPYTSRRWAKDCSK